jgi:hypothetical protein
MVMYPPILIFFTILKIKRMIKVLNTKFIPSTETEI